ncbi:hypothetical protein EDB83DRAFT_2323418 [Lactarius deliciosus]|nr:hypothetical protein EDB83DRAFT_2323418 [Lactarius deliciosus]
MAQYCRIVPSGELKLRMNTLAVHDGMSQTRWRKVLKEAEALLDSAMSLSGSEVDLSSQFENRVAMLRDEIGLKREMLGARATYQNAGVGVVPTYMSRELSFKCHSVTIIPPFETRV